MTTRTMPTLVKLGDTDLTVADRAEDIRGYEVLDPSGEKIGTVEGLLIDQEQSKVRFMEVAHGGLLGIGEKTFLLPVDAITKIHENHVHVDQSKERISGAPSYNPDLISERDLNDVYGYYGHSPFWMGGYVYPAYPFYRGL